MTSIKHTQQIKQHCNWRPKTKHVHIQAIFTLAPSSISVAEIAHEKQSIPNILNKIPDKYIVDTLLEINYFEANNTQSIIYFLENIINSFTLHKTINFKASIPD